jgi:hypothetical protein
VRVDRFQGCRSWAHIVISNFKRWQLDVFHGVSAAHVQSYLDEFSYRLNRRDARLDLFRRILNRCVLYTPPTRYSELIATWVEGTVSSVGTATTHSTPRDPTRFAVA